MRARRNRLRLYTLGVIFTLVTITLWARLIQVQVFSHDYYQKKARKQRFKTIKIPPIRGSIYDRHGRPLALSTRSYSISVNPSQVGKKSSEVIRRVSRTARIPRSVVRKSVKSDGNFAYIKRKCSLSDEQVRRLQEIPGIEIHVEADRTYPFGTVANKVVGFFGYDDRGMAGIEAAFDGELSGEPGWESIILDGRYKVHKYGMSQRKRPVNGKSIVLTIDAAIQEIADVELEKAVKKSKARWGAVIMIDCKTGEILTLSEYPSARSRAFSSRADSLWTIRSISCVYEPGSTFKLITAASLLETGVEKPSDVFFAENGKADLEFARISDAHPHGYLTFREGFVQSSNIVMAKASLKLPAEKFYEFIRLFGFGSRTGIELMGESPGKVAPVEDWSKRTQVTIAFGQEIAVTPLQMLNSFAAVANDGVLMVPTIVKAVIDENGSVVKRNTPVKIRNLISKQTALTLKSFCRDVVTEGTGKSADIDILQVSGKTGTGQKASKRGGYLPGKYVASFIGFIPYRDPQIACLVMLDEPNYAQRFGGVSAAPVFAEICRSVANSTDLFDKTLAKSIVKREMPKGRAIATPNFIRMNADAAKAEAKRKGLRVMCNAEKGKIISQKPDPGVLIERDDIIRLFIDRDTKPVNVPDLTGLSLREAKKLLVDSGLHLSFKGSGTVTSQSPKPGQRFSSGLVKIRCGGK